MTKYKPTYYSLVRLSRPLKWTLGFLVLLALLGDVVSNEKPIYYQENGVHHFPVFSSYMAKLGWGNTPNEDWSNKEYEKLILPLIPYSYDTNNPRDKYQSPFGKQGVKSWRWRHWLGTDALGRDLTAGLINGLKIALLIASGTVLLMSLIGIPFGLLCGYFGDEHLTSQLGLLIFTLLGAMVGSFYALIAFPDFMGSPYLIFNLLSKCFLFLFFVFCFRAIGSHVPILKREIKIPIDFIGQRIIEVLDAIPSLFLILPLMAILSDSIWDIIWIVALLSWTGIARLVRAELLQIRSLPYIESAKALGLSDVQIIFKHALPNALKPVIVVLAFSFGSIVMIEAFLTFLGFGLSTGEVTWGSILNGARANIRAWWLVLFPSMAIFTLVSLANYIGRSIEENA